MDFFDYFEGAVYQVSDVLGQDSIDYFKLWIKN